MGAYRDDAQRAAVAKAFADRSGALRGWAFDSRGPTAAAVAIREGRAERPGWSTSAWVLWHFSWSVWEDTAMVQLDELLYSLDQPNLIAVGSFLVAFAHDARAVDLWLEKQAQSRAA